MLLFNQLVFILQNRRKINQTLFKRDGLSERPTVVTYLESFNKTQSIIL